MEITGASPSLEVGRRRELRFGLGSKARLKDRQTGAHIISVTLRDGREAAICRVASHRATSKLKQLVGSELEWYFNLWDGNNFAAVPLDLLPQAKAITGVTLARTTRPLYRCWSW